MTVCKHKGNRMIESSRSPAVAEIAKREFDLLVPIKNSEMEVKQATVNDAEKACKFSENKIPNSIADVSLIQKVIIHNSDNIFIFNKKNHIVGVFAMLMLRPLGLERLLLDEFDGKNPDFKCLAKTGECPAAIYIWSYIAPGSAANGVREISKFLQQPKYLNINFFARPVTELGIRITENLGYEPINNTTNGLYRYVRLVNRDPDLQHLA